MTVRPVDVPRRRARAARLLLRTALMGSALAIAAPARAQSDALRPLQWVPVGGIHFLGPLRASVAGGILGIFQEGRSDKGVHALVDVGLGGTKLRGGFASAKAFVSGYTVEGSLMRTFGNPVGADRWRTYAGGEVHGMLVLLNFGIGVYAPLGDGKTLTTLTVGLGF